MNALFGIKPDNHATSYIPFAHILYCTLLSNSQVEVIGDKRVCVSEKTLLDLRELPRYRFPEASLEDALKELQDNNMIGIVGDVIYLGTYVDKIFTPYLPVEDSFKSAKKTLQKEIASAEKDVMSFGGGEWLPAVRELSELSKEEVEKYGIAGKIYGGLCNLYCRGNMYAGLTQRETHMLRTTLIRRYGNVETFCLMVKVLFVNNVDNKKLPEIFSLVSEVTKEVEKTRVKKPLIDEEDELMF